MACTVIFDSPAIDDGMFFHEAQHDEYTFPFKVRITKNRIRFGEINEN